LSIETPAEGHPSARADAVSGAIWLAIGAAIVAGSWNMDRLEKQGVQWFAAPGLVPGILGLFIVSAALLIVGRSLARLSRGEAGTRAPEPGYLRRTALTLALCLAFAVGLVGHGLPFGVAAALYLFVHIFLLQLPERRANGEIARGVLVAGGVAVGAATAIALVFQDVFLVRLP
jgi:putative tricarboxylic transport membrane protein